MEAMSGVRAVVMDKTGTLTQGDFRVQEIRGDDELLRLCAACEETSTHPIAVSIVSAARERGMQWSRPQELAEIPGRGIRAVLDGKVILCGNEKLMAENGVEIPFEQQDVEISSNGTQTIITCTVPGEQLYPATNLQLTDGVLAWNAPQK